MTLGCAVGKSKSRDGLLAGRQVASLCNQELAGRKPDLLIVFASPQLPQEQMIAGVLEIYPNVPLIGCSSSGEIFASETDSNSVVMAALCGVDVQLEHGGDLSAVPPKLAGSWVKTFSARSPNRFNVQRRAGGQYCGRDPGRAAGLEPDPPLNRRLRGRRFFISKNLPILQPASPYPNPRGRRPGRSFCFRRGRPARVGARRAARSSSPGPGSTACSN